MFLTFNAARFRRSGLLVLVASCAALAVGCGHATQSASPQSRSGTAGLTSAPVTQHFTRVLVADKGTVAVVVRDGCLASVGSGTDNTGKYDEMRVRCPHEDRLATWFDGIDHFAAGVALERVPDDADLDDEHLPAAQLMTTGGTVMRVKQSSDASRLLGEVRNFSSELQANERPNPGPASPGGWQMLRVSGPAHVHFGGEPTHGVLDARISTNGQYLCEYVTNTNDGPLHATKSGYIPADKAAHAIDEVLAPFRDLGPDERPRSTYALAVADGTERHANTASIAEVFDRFGPLQDALGDACIPELETPAPPGP